MSEQEDRPVAPDLGKPACKACHGENAGPKGKPPQHLHKAQLAFHVGFRPRRAVGSYVVNDLRRYGIGDNVLEYNAHDDEQSRHDIKCNFA